MTTLNLSYTKPIKAGTTVLTSTLAAPQFLQNYTAEHEVARIAFTPVKGDIISLFSFVSISTDQQFFNFPEERLTIYVSAKLVDQTEVQDVPGAIQKKQVWTRMNDVIYGTNAMEETISDRFSTNDFLIPGHTYAWIVSVRKEQSFGAATIVVAIDDETAFGYVGNRAF